MEERDGLLPNSLARNFFAQTLEAVGGLHGRGWCHHDLSMHNIMVTGGGGGCCASSGDDASAFRLTLIDFGANHTRALALRVTLAAGFAQRTGAPLHMYGHTPYFAGPEVLARQPHHGEAVDVFSLGVILFALLCGRLPYCASSVAQLRALLATDCPPLPAWLTHVECDLIEWCLALEPHERPTTREIAQHPWLCQ